MPEQLSENAQKVQAALAALGLPLQVVELPASTRTAPEAAEAIGCQIAQIVKSLVFKGGHSGKPLLVLVSGSNRADEARLSELAGEPVEKASPDFVRQHTGFVIGGVPPLGHPQPLQTFIDEDLLNYPEIWAAAGTPRAVFRLGREDLNKITTGKIVRLASQRSP
ncbi:MAG: YbaK/EbsC family protein [Anaerolineaceae bacterium]|nr:YbaK/EbsC family protein [Anaerolineaceae bacterium]